MKYIVGNSVIRLDIGVIVPLLVLPRIVFSTLNIPFGPVSCSTVYIAVFLYLFRYGSFRKFIQSSPFFFWMLLIAFHHINGFVKNVPSLRLPDYYHAIKMYCAVCIYSFLFCVDLKKTLRYLIISLFIWLVIAIGPVGIKGSARLSGKNAIAVVLGKYAAVLAICVIYYKSLKHAKWINTIVYLIPAFVVVLLSQTRTAFGVILIQMMGYFYGVKMKGRIKINSIVLVSILLLILYGGMNYIIDNTGIGARFTDEKAYNYYNKKNIVTGTIFDKIAGERLIYYVFGYMLYEKSPLTGIGYNNYQNATKGDYPMHVEYMVHLCEGGIIASVIFVLFWVSMLRLIFKRHYDSSVFVLLMSTAVSHLFSSMYSVSFNQEIPVIVYGLLIAAGKQVPSSSNENFSTISSNLLTTKVCYEV